MWRTSPCQCKEPARTFVCILQISLTYVRCQMLCPLCVCVAVCVKDKINLKHYSASSKANAFIKSTHTITQSEDATYFHVHTKLIRIFLKL